MTNRFNFLGVWISKINPAEARQRISEYSFESPGYICFPDASVVKDASKDEFLTNILNSSFLTMPDGKPSQLAAKLQGVKGVKTVSGFHLCKSLLTSNLTHYFYGSDDEGLQKLKEKIESDFPKANVLGYKSPPFVSKGEIEENQTIISDITEINQLKPDLVWIGISSPKQDYLMHFHHKRLDKSLMLGIGGALLYFSDSSMKSPEWIKKIGFRWAYRLAKEPRRLWKKYFDTFCFLFRNSPYFMKAFLKQKLN